MLFDAGFALRAKSQADKDIAGRNKYLSLEPPGNESFLANSNGSKGRVQSVTQPDKNTLILATRDCQSLTIKVSYFIFSLYI